jgi:hypothetical protein
MPTVLGRLREFGRSVTRRVRNALGRLFRGRTRRSASSRRSAAAEGRANRMGRLTVREAAAPVVEMVVQPVPVAPKDPFFEMLERGIIDNRAEEDEGGFEEEYEHPPVQVLPPGLSAANARAVMRRYMNNTQARLRSKKSTYRPVRIPSAIHFNPNAFMGRGRSGQQGYQRRVAEPQISAVYRIGNHTGTRKNWRRL